MLLVVDDRVQKVKSRRVFREHPTEEMEEEEILEFQRNPVRYPECTLTSLHYSVLKRHHRRASFPQPSTREFYFTFYAFTGETYGENLTELPNANWKRMYVNQIAYIQCTHGWIDDLTVFDYPLTPVLNLNPTESPKRCGIGTVLTELCLIDPGINVRRQGNLARHILSGFPVEFPRVERDCPTLVGLGCATDTMAGAHTYFTAGINMGYRLLLIEVRDDEGQYSIKTFPTDDAKRDYNVETGRIEPCDECSDMCQAWGRRWFFCTGQV